MPSRDPRRTCGSGVCVAGDARISNPEQKGASGEGSGGEARGEHSRSRSASLCLPGPLGGPSCPRQALGTVVTSPSLSHVALEHRGNRALWRQKGGSLLL